MMIETDIQREALFAILNAFANNITDHERLDALRGVLDDKLGKGWAREYNAARSPEERKATIKRRLMAHTTVRAKATAPAQSSVNDDYLYEDGGAR